jgi:phosphoglucomutase
MKISPFAGKVPANSMLVNIPKLITAYYSEKPDPKIAAQRISFGTSGHRGSSLKSSFNENHILAITQAICLYRKQNKIEGPLFIGIDTHALSEPAFTSTMEVLAANGVEVMVAKDNEYVPTPAISHAILTYNKGRKDGLADGIVITPSHNPPDDGGFKYNPTTGGPAGGSITSWIENKANEILENDLKDVKRISFEKAMRASRTHEHDYVNNYVNDLANVINMDLLRESKIKIGVDPLGGAGVNYWQPIADRYKIDLTVVNKDVDPTFSFMTMDWDGKVRMDPSSAYAMNKLIEMKDRFDISFACDTDHDRHGIVTKSAGLMNPNNYLAVAVNYLLKNRPLWNNNVAIAKTLVTSQLIERITKNAGKKLYDVPVGFKWFVDGLLDSSLCFAGEESAGATFSRFDGTVWTTDKDGFIPALLSAEITAKEGKDPGVIYKELTKEYGEPFYDRVEAKAGPEQKSKLKKLNPSQIKETMMAGELITDIATNAPGNGAAIDGLKVSTANGWFAARPSGTEDIYKIYAESFLGADHLKKIMQEAQTIVDSALEEKVPA